ncbi:MAG: hypothetical protein IKJ24_00665 [Clostridia bacterium]|nr:hypothetical protein [Clostridia bacterium]
MKAYIISVMCISVIGSLLSMLTPEGEGGGIMRNNRLVFGLCVVLVCINPIKSIINEVKSLDIGSIVEIPDSDFERYEEYLGGAYTDAEVENLKAGIYQMLEDRFSVPRENCSVAVNLRRGEGGTSSLERIFITLYGGAIFKNTNEIEDYFGSIFNCEIVTVIG